MKLYPLSLPQQAMFLDALKYGDTAKFNMGAISIVSGPFDTLLFQKSLEFAHRVHDVRRMRVHIDGEGAWQEFLAGRRGPVLRKEGTVAANAGEAE